MACGREGLEPRFTSHLCTQLRTRRVGRSGILGTLLALHLLMSPGLVAAGGVEDALAAQTGSLSGPSSIGGASIVAVDFIKSFYAIREYRPAWTGTAAGKQLFSEIAASPNHGLRPTDFNFTELAQLRTAAENGNTQAIADFEIAATDAAIRLLHHLYFGKVDPERLDPDWNFERPMISGNPAEMLSDFVDGNGYSILVADVSPKHPQYLALQGALEQYRSLEANGGWPAIPAQEALKPGADDDRVPLLRKRLTLVGDLRSNGARGTVYDGYLEAAVKRFQDRHGLDTDGVIGGKTFEALNMPAADRVDQLRLTLERARWILRGLGGDFVLVNIAGSETYLARNGKIVWRTRSITGQQYRKTPIFRDEIRYMELNPTWTVPASIFRKDKLPRIRKDGGYLSRGGYTLRGRDGQPVDPSAVNWSAKNPGVTLVQKPGPKNALGLVKFMFPNKYAVYLHDTDDRSLFGRAERNLSSGCVRVEDPFAFADLLMQGSTDWNSKRREEILASGKTTRVNLPKPMPVLLTYFTAWVEGEGVQFRRDIYERDDKLLKALNGAFRR